MYFIKSKVWRYLYSLCLHQLHLHLLTCVLNRNELLFIYSLTYILSRSMTYFFFPSSGILKIEQFKSKTLFD